MSTVEVEILRKEANEEERREIEQLRQKYKQRQKQRQQQNTPQNTTNPEKEALIQQAQQQEQQEKEQIRQKYKQRQKQRQQQNTPQNITYPETGGNDQDHNITTKNPEKEDLYKRALNREIIENDDIWEQFLVKKSKQNAERFNQFNESYEYELESEGIETDRLESNGLETDGLESENLGISEFNGEIDQLETVDRSALLAKYSIKDAHEDDVTNLLENFDRSINYENVEEIEERLMETIKHSALSHPKIEWVNVLVFLDEEQMKGSIKILAEYDNKNFLKRIISDNNKKLEVELIQIALYEVWDVFTTLGVNTNDLESRIEVEVELDRA